MSLRNFTEESRINVAKASTTGELALILKAIPRKRKAIAPQRTLSVEIITYCCSQVSPIRSNHIEKSIRTSIRT